MRHHKNKAKQNKNYYGCSLKFVEQVLCVLSYVRCTVLVRTPTRDFKISTKDHELCHISDMGQEVTATIMEV